jgi:two-component sensor histidine kinase
MPELAPHFSVLEERLLLQELTHRVNNEFASLIGTVSRAAATSSNDEVKRALSGVEQLLYQHAEVHRVLQPPDLETFVDAADYIDKLCRSISRSRLERMNIGLVLAAAPLQLESGRCWRLGMIVSELTTNAQRHAFAGRPGKIRVELFGARGLVRCTVSDDGSAPARIQLGRGSSIVEELTRGLNGRFERKFGPNGSSSTLIFPYRSSPPPGSGYERIGFSARCKSALPGSYWPKTEIIDALWTPPAVLKA